MRVLLVLGSPVAAVWCMNNTGYRSTSPRGRPARSGHVSDSPPTSGTLSGKSAPCTASRRYAAPAKTVVAASGSSVATLLGPVEPHVHPVMRSGGSMAVSSAIGAWQAIDGVKSAGFEGAGCRGFGDCRVKLVHTGFRGCGDKEAGDMP